MIEIFSRRSSKDPSVQNRMDTIMISSNIDPLRLDYVEGNETIPT